MKKKEFKKLKVGDKVTIRTLEELEQLKCYSSGGVRDDEGYLWLYLSKVHKEVLGRECVVIYVSFRGNAIEVEIDGNEFYVVRQHLKGRADSFFEIPRKCLRNKKQETRKEELNHD